MANMSYCRFENTYRALQDCYYNIDNDLSESEHMFRNQLVDLCKAIADRYEPVEFDNQNQQDEQA